MQCVQTHILFLEGYFWSAFVVFLMKWRYCVCPPSPYWLSLSADLRFLHWQSLVLTRRHFFLSFFCGLSALQLRDHAQCSFDDVDVLYHQNLVTFVTTDRSRLKVSFLTTKRTWHFVTFFTWTEMNFLNYSLRSRRDRFLCSLVFLSLMKKKNIVLVCVLSLSDVQTFLGPVSCILYALWRNCRCLVVDDFSSSTLEHFSLE